MRAKTTTITAALFLAAITGLGTHVAGAQAIDRKDGYYVDRTYQPLEFSKFGRTMGWHMTGGNDKGYLLKDTSPPVSFAYAQYQWPGTYFEAAFEGAEVVVKLRDTRNILHLSIDDQPPIVLTKPGNIEYRIKGLSIGRHTIRLANVTEFQSPIDDYEGLYGFYVPKGQTPLPAPAHSRQIEFIGDSWTVGYGNTSTTHTCPGDQVWATTNTQEAFGALTAKHYNADYQINAISGRGIVRNYNGGPGAHLPEAYPYELFDQKTEYKDPNWQPQIIVIGLGTNDFSTPLNPGEKWKTRDDLHADYEATYVAFVQSIRAKNPKASFILMASDGANGEIQSEVQKVIATLQKAGESRIAFLGMKDLSLGGCDWHPNTADDQMISKSLISFIDAHAELWQGK